MKYKTFYDIPEKGYFNIIANQFWKHGVGISIEYNYTDFQNIFYKGMVAYFTPLKIYFNFLDLEFESLEIENKKLKELIKEL